MTQTSLGFSTAAMIRAARTSFSQVLPMLRMWMPNLGSNESSLPSADSDHLPSARRFQTYDSICLSQFLVPMWHWAASMSWISSSVALSTAGSFDDMIFGLDDDERLIRLENGTSSPRSTLFDLVSPWMCRFDSPEAVWLPKDVARCVRR